MTVLPVGVDAPRSSPGVPPEAGDAALRVQRDEMAAEVAGLRGTLAASEQLRHAVLDALDVGVVVRAVPSGRVLLCNAAAEQMIGVRKDSLPGHVLHKGWTWVHPDGSPVARDDLPTPTVVRAGQPLRNLRLGVDTGDGAFRWLDITALPVRDGDGRMTSVVTSIDDVTDQLAGRSALERSQRRLAAAQAITGLAWWEYDVDNDRHAWSDQMFALLGLAVGEAPGREAFFEFVHPEDRPKLEPQQMSDAGGGSRVFRVTRTDGAVRYLQSWSDVVRDDAGVVRQVRGTTLDVTERERAARAVADSELLFRVAFDHAPTGMALVSLAPDRFGQVLRANRAMADMLGAEVEGTVGQSIRRWMHPADVPSAEAHLRSLSAGSPPRAVEQRLVRRDGAVVHTWLSTARLDQGPDAEPCVLAHVVDLSEQRRDKAALERLAMTDSVTGLANRAQLEQWLRAALRRLPRTPPTKTTDDATTAPAVSLLLLDLDRFKLVNDSLGHPVGDTLLVEVARRLERASRGNARVARLGGDEFVVLVEGPESAAVRLATRIVEDLRSPYVLPAGHHITTTGTVGIGVARSAGRTSSDLLREADLALYQAKDAGRDRVAVCGDDLRAEAVGRMTMESRLRHALTHGGLRLDLQPVVDLDDERVVAAEALVRVHDGDGSLLAPGAFIEMAEETGLVAELDAWVATEAIRLLSCPDVAAPVIAVNVSGRTLQEPRFVDHVAAALRRHGVGGGRLLVEITERVVLESTQEVHRSLDGLRALGIGVGIDDFGTGYSALAYLQRLPLDFLKIDRSFVVRLGETDERAEAMVRAIVDLAHAHGLVVTAEGVETPDQATALRRAGCDRAQGWLFGRPATPYPGAAA